MGNGPDVRSARLIIRVICQGSYLAEKWANSATSVRTQYAGLACYVVGEFLVFVPLISFALLVTETDDPMILPRAALVTLGIFGGLSAVVFLTRHDFSFLRGALYFGGIAAFFLVAYGTPRGWVHSLSHIECDVALPHQAACRRILGALRFGDTSSLVRFAYLSEPSPLTYAIRTCIP
jgi:Inhibitor of apoptosis-promoting Bax1